MNDLLVRIQSHIDKDGAEQNHNAGGELLRECMTKIEDLEEWGARLEKMALDSGKQKVETDLENQCLVNQANDLKGQLSIAAREVRKLKEWVEKL